MITAVLFAALLSAQTAPPSRPGPQPYPAAPGAPVRAAERGVIPPTPGVDHPPRIGVQASEAHSPGGHLIAGYAEAASGRWISEFYLLNPWRAPGADPVVFARRALDSYEAQEQIVWADSRACPGLISALAAANALPLPAFILPLDEAGRARARALGRGAAPMADGPGPHVFWGMTWGEAGTTVQFSTYGGPWVAWSRSAETVLAPCWRDERPAPPARG